MGMRFGTYGYVVQDIWVCGSGHRGMLFGTYGYVVRDIWVCCSGHMGMWFGTYGHVVFHIFAVVLQRFLDAAFSPF